MPCLPLNRTPMKRIICCSDGTWNKPGALDGHQAVQTNVLKLYNCIAPKDEAGNPQMRYYDTGVGTTWSSKTNILQGVTGAGIDKNIQDAYKFIMWHYEPGDEIWLFGFSRGAYTARSIAGLIRNCGVLRPENLPLLREAYELYRDRSAITGPDSDLMRAFRARYSHEPRIRFVGVWDTVGALGIPLKPWSAANMRRYQFHDVTLSSTIDHAYHALALHERRNTFRPTLWRQSNTAKAQKGLQQMQQVWFAGVHSNVGGGYADAGLSDTALDWMARKARAAGLALNPDFEQCCKPDFEKGILRRSDSLLYRLLGTGWRSICQAEDSCEFIHPSVIPRWQDARNLPRDVQAWLLREEEKAAAAAVV